MERRASSEDRSRAASKKAKTNLEIIQEKTEENIETVILPFKVEEESKLPEE